MLIDVQFDTEALSKEYGMSAGTIGKRWYRLKKKLEAAEAAESAKAKGDEKTAQGDDEQDDTRDEDMDESD